MTSNKPVYKAFKRLMDVICSILFIIFLSLFFLLIPAVIFISMGSPVIFRQKRVGKNNRTFTILKFRTMREKSVKYGSDSERITWVGRFLRLFRLDELPQLFNVLLGDMSFIGPRPLLPEYLPFYTTKEIARHDVRPGLSGYGQIKSLNYPKWEEQFNYDIYYVENLSFRLDMVILFRTLEKIIQPSSMVTTGVAEGRPSFDVYRKQQIRQNPQMQYLLSEFENTN